MSLTVLLTFLTVLLSSAGGYDGPRYAQRKQINGVVRFISDIQLYQSKKENSRSRSIFFQPCPPGKVRGLRGKCRTAHKQKIPNALHRLNQFLKKRKKYEKRKNTDYEKLNKTEKVIINNANIIKESDKENVEYQQELNQSENVPVETTTNVVFLDLSNETNETKTVEEDEERGNDVSITRRQEDKEDPPTTESGDRNSIITIIVNRQKELKQDTTTMMTTEGSGGEEVVTELVSIAQTETEDEESSAENSLEYQIVGSEEFLDNDNEIMENMFERESSGDMENLEVNVLFP